MGFILQHYRMTVATGISSSPLAYRAAGVFFTLYDKCGVPFVLRTTLLMVYDIDGLYVVKHQIYNELEKKKEKQSVSLQSALN
jgi:hypothetical protein